VNVDNWVDIDFNGTPDRQFGVGQERTPDTNDQTDRLLLKDDGKAFNEGYVALNGQPAALTFGTPIGPTDAFESNFFDNTGNRLVDEDADNDGFRDEILTGNFTPDNIVGNPQYLGVRFKLDENAAEDYFGWIGVDITSADDLTGVVTGYAYENVAGVGIEAGAVPEPAGLALLALGAAGLLARRRA
jgi:hypothetical protein